MEIYNEVLKRVSPCGVNCSKCFAFHEGKIKKESETLKKELGNFEPYAKRFIQQMDSVFGEYPAFKKMLDYFAQLECTGCRQEKCAFFADCNVRQCTIDHKVDFCYQCEAFPCDISHTGMDQDLYDRYVGYNRKMKEIGPEAYYDEIKNNILY